MGAHETDRRAFLMAARALAVLTAGPTTALAPVVNDRSAWDAAMRTFESIVAEIADFSPVWERTHAAYKPDVPSMDGIHWQEFHHGDRNHIARVLDLDKAWARFLDGEGKWWFSADREKCKARHRAALDSIQAYRDADKRHYRDSGMEAADARNDALADAEYEAEMALMDMPAPDLGALAWKLQRIFEIDGPDETMSPWTVSYVGQAIADCRRLLGEAR